MLKNRILTSIGAIFWCSLSTAWAVSSGWAPVQLEWSVPNVFVGSLFATGNFGITETITLGPSVGFYPLYFFNPGNPVFAYEFGIDSNFYFFGNRLKNSAFVNVFSYFSGYQSERAEQPSVHSGFNLGYRWFLPTRGDEPSRWLISVGAGVKCIYSHLEVFSYRPDGRVSEGSVDNFIPLGPSLKATLGLLL